MPGRPRLASISPEASADEVAAIVAALTLAERRRRQAAMAASVVSGGGGPDVQALDHWRLAPRLGATRAGMTRGPWRLAGRLTRRARA